MFLHERWVDGENIRSFPRIINPDISNGPGRGIASMENILGESTLLRLILVVQDEDAEIRLLALTTEFLDGGLDVLFEFADGVFEGCAGVVDFIDNQDIFADEVGHFERGQVEPLGAGDFCAGLFDFRVFACAELFVEGEADGLDGDVGRAGLLEEGPELGILVSFVSTTGQSRVTAKSAYRKMRAGT